MSFDEVNLPGKIEFGALGGPQFKTEVVMLGSGHEQRNAEWSRVRHAWDVAPGIQSTQDLDNVIAFWYARQGRLRGFRFRDRTDSAVNGQVLIAAASGGETSVQLFRSYSSGPITYDRPVFKPVLGSLTLYVDGSPVSASLDSANGIVTFAALAPGVQLSADFQYDIPVRFDSDHLRIQNVTHARDAVRSLPIIETRDI
jgi:uncharacterized protein (TIGR02217 family)